MTKTITPEELAEMLTADKRARPFADGGIGDLMSKRGDAYLQDYVLSTDEGSDYEPNEFERILLEDFMAGLLMDEVMFAPVRALLDLAESARRYEAQEKNHGVARFVDAEEIAELMEAGARTWMPIALATPERNGSIIVMTSDDAPVIGQAFWHEHGDGTWALHWSAVSPKEDCWNDPISETNKPIVCFQPMPEGPCDERVKAMASPSPHMAALLRIKVLEEACQEAVGLLLERIHHNPARSAAHNARLTLQAALSPAQSTEEEKGQ